MYPGHQPSRDPRLRLMALKRVDGLQNLMGTLDIAKHQYWSEHGVNNHIFQTAYDNPKHFKSSEIQNVPSLTRQSSTTAFKQLSSHNRPLSSSVPRHPALPSANASMAELNNMDSSSLVAAALAPSAGPQQRADMANSRKAGNGMNDVVQAVSPRPVMQSR
jgi:hypothetical protein